MLYQNEYQVCEDALFVQDACNITAVAGVLHEMCLFLSRSGKGTGDIKFHPAIILVADKIADLTGRGSYGPMTFSPAYDYCVNVSQAGPSAEHLTAPKNLLPKEDRS